MNRLSNLLLTIWLWPILGMAQFTATEPDYLAPPSQSFANTVPEASAWSVRIVDMADHRRQQRALVNSTDDSAPTETENHPRYERYKQMLAKRRVIGMEAAYQDGVRREILHFANGTRVARYLTGRLILHQHPESGEVILESEFSATGPLWGVGRFNELSWVEDKYYMGITEHRGVECYVFQKFADDHSRPAAPTSTEKAIEAGDEASRLEETAPWELPPGSALHELEDTREPRVLATAFINRETMLPVALEVTGETWIYDMDQDYNPFEIPSAIAQELNNDQQALRRLDQRFNIPQ